MNAATILSKVSEIKLDVSSVSSDYTIDYVREKLAQVSALREQLTDLTYDYFLLEAQANNRSTQTKVALLAAIVSAKGNPTFATEKVANQTAIVEAATLREVEADLVARADGKNLLLVRDFIRHKKDTLMTLDSDLRLHSQFMFNNPTGAVPGVICEIGMSSEADEEAQSFG